MMWRSLVLSRRSCRRFRGVTLLEMLLAVSLILLTLSTLFLFYEISLGATRRAEKFTARTQQARVVLQQIAREIRQAHTGRDEQGIALSGTMHSLTLSISVLPDVTVMQTYGIGDQVPPAVCDIRQVQYYMAVDPDDPDDAGNPGVVGLVRSEQRPNEEDIVEKAQLDKVRHVRMMAPDVKYIRLYYFDGSNWLDAWQGAQGTNGLPQAIKIEIGFTPDVPMLANEEQATGTEVDLLGNVEGASPADGHYTLIVRPPTVGLFSGAGSSTQSPGGLPGAGGI
jgi:type II secretory pathway pseudopilin PulG